MVTELNDKVDKGIHYPIAYGLGKDFKIKIKDEKLKYLNYLKSL